MATPTRLSVSNVALPNTADSGSVSITIPTGANACRIAGTYYVADSSVPSSVTGSAFAATTNGGLRVNNPSSGAYMGAFSVLFKVTATGSQTIRVQKTGGYSEGPTCQIIWYTVDDPDNFVPTGGHLVAQPTAVPQALALTVNSNTTDLVDGMFGTDGSSADPSAPTGTTQQGTMQTTQFDKQIAFSVNSPGASTTSVTAGSRDYPSLSLAALRGSSGAASHDASGSLVGQGSTVAGSAARTRAHPASGALVGQGSTVVGSAQRNSAHASSGALTGQGSTVAGSANRTRQHPASGALTGQGSEVSGSANRTRAHASSGALTGQGSEVAGSAARTRAHGSSGALVGPGSEIVGSADHQSPAGTHDATGALVGQGSAVSGAAARLRAFSASGALVGQGSLVAGAAARVAPAVSHDATGVLVGQGSAVAGQANHGDEPPQPGGHFNGGFVIDYTDSALWWKRKPKAVPVALAEKRIKRVAKAIDEIAAEKIEQDEPINQRDVREEIAPLLAQMPGFDWRPLFRAVVEYRQQEAARLEAVAQIERIRAIERDDEDVLFLLMSF